MKILNRLFTNISINFLILALLSGALVISSWAQEDVSFKEKKDQEGYVVNIKDLIKKSKQKIEKVNEELQDQAQLRRNQKREEKAREYYETGMRLIEEEKFEEAREMFEKAIKITEHPEMQDYLGFSVKKTARLNKVLEKEEERRLERLETERGFNAKDVQKTYSKGVKLYEQRKFIAARQAFEQVDTMFPDHKATRSYLQLISQEIDKEQKQMIEAKLKEDAYGRLEAKEKWRKELEEKEKGREEKLEDQAEELYKQAVSLYKEKKYLLAKDKFKEVEWVLPGYKKTGQYLRKLDKDVEPGKVLSLEDKQEFLAKQMREEKLAEKEKEDEFNRQLKEKEQQEITARQQEEAAFIYNAAIELYKRKEYVQAREKFVQVAEIYPNYKSTDQYLKRIEKRVGDGEQYFIPSKLVKDEQKSVKDKKEEGPVTAFLTDSSQYDLSVQKAIEERQRKIAQQAEEMYKYALSSYKANNFFEAKERFIEVESFYPGYKDTLDYLSRIDDDIQSNKPGMKSLAAVKTKEESQEHKKSSDKKSEKIAKKKESLNKEKPVKESRPQPVSRSKNLSEQQEEELNAKYKAAKSLYRAQQYANAKEKFEEVLEVSPDYKMARSYVWNINRKIKHEEKELKSLRDKHDKTAERQSEEIRTRLQRDRDQIAKQAERQEREIQEKIEENYEKQVESGKENIDEKHGVEKKLDLEAHDSKEIEEKKVSADEVVEIKDAAIQEKNRDIKKSIQSVQETQVKAAEEKKVPVDVVVEIKDTAIQEKNRDIKKSLQDVQETQEQKLERQINDLYLEAVQLYKDGEFITAKNKFQLVENMRPGYRLSRYYIQRAEKRAVDESKVFFENVKKVEKQAKWETAREAHETSRKIQELSDEQKKMELKAKEELDRIRNKGKKDEKEGVTVITKEEKADQVRVKKEEAEYIKKMEEERNLQKLQNFEQAKAEINNTYNIALRLQKEERAPEAEEELKKIEGLLANPDLEDGYRREMKSKVDMQREKINQAVFKTKQQMAEEEKEQIAKLKEAIKHQEKDLITQRQKYRQRYDTYEEKENALAGLVEERKIGIRSDREVIRKELDKKLAELYSRAVALYNSGKRDQAKGLFNEINQLEPGYKNTEDYLSDRVSLKLKNVEKKEIVEDKKPPEEEPKKGSFFSNIFGGKKKAEPEEELFTEEEKLMRYSSSKDSRQDLISQALDEVEQEL